MCRTVALGGTNEGDSCGEAEVHGGGDVRVKARWVKASLSMSRMKHDFIKQADKELKALH